MLKFAFVNDAARREYKKLPIYIQDTFGKDLRKIQYGQKPSQPVTFLDSIGAGVIELKINGSPAHRCIYVTKYHDTIIVLHSFAKTTNGVDKPAMQVAKSRLKVLLTELKNEK